MKLSTRLLAYSRRTPLTTSVYVRPALIMLTPPTPATQAAPAASPSPMASPPHKRPRMISPHPVPPRAMSPPRIPARATLPPTMPTDPGPSKASTSVLEAPVRAMFAPNRTKAEIKRDAKRSHRPVYEPYSVQDVLWHDVRDFLGPEIVDEVIARGDGSDWKPPADLQKGEEYTVRVGAFTVSGDSLSLFESEHPGKKWALLVPFAHPGDLVKCRVHRHDHMHSTCDLVEILEYDETHRGGEGDRRKNPQSGCKYFGTCGGCQLQPIPYTQQLQHKRRTVELAYKRYSRLDADQIPSILDTIASPKQWGYRTKLTPHFDAPPNWLKSAMARIKQRPAGEEEEGANGLTNGQKGVWSVMVDEKDTTKQVRGRGKAKDVTAYGIKPGTASSEGAMVERLPQTERTWDLRIGFDGRSSGTIDIEECPIATPIVNTSLAEQRQRTQDTIMSYARGATLLLRDSLPIPSTSSISPFDPATPVIPDEDHIAVINHKLPVYERVGDKLFTFTAGAFFQNNNSILVPLTDYVREAVFPPGIAEERKPTHLVDTYCGSGLFGITLSGGFEKVAGVEIDPQSVEAAKKNAAINGLQDKTTWFCGKAEDLFGGLPRAGFAGNHSCVVVDPPRKGCDEPFLEQLLNFKPLTVVYVSCNVHTQARDVGWLLKVGEIRGIKYKLESLRGFDLFPQTSHVESVAVLRLVE